MVKADTFVDKGLEEGLSQILAGMANHGLASRTWKGYEVVINHLTRCQLETGVDMSLPFDEVKLLTIVGWMRDKRELRSASISKYLSGLRMYHLANGFFPPCLRPPLVKLIFEWNDQH